MKNYDHNSESKSSPKQTHIETNFATLPINPSLRKKNYDYHPNESDQIRRHYLQKKSCVWQLH